MLSVCPSLYFLAQHLHSSTAELALVLCVSAWGALIVDMCIHVRKHELCVCPTWHIAVCVCVSMCVSLLYSSCLLTSIHSLMTELHSKSLQAATFRAPPKQTHISNNASWDWSQITQWNVEFTHSCVQSNHQQRWIDSLFVIDQVLHLRGRQEKCTHSTLTILDFSAIVGIKGTNWSSTFAQFHKPKLLFSLTGGGLLEYYIE